MGSELPRAWEGTHVVVELAGDDGAIETLAFDLVGEAAAAIDEGLLSVASPLGRAILGQQAGGQVAYVRGDIRRVRVVSVGPAQREADPEAAERQRAAVEEARRKAERTNADMFASSFSGKWGNYSTDEME
jgi:hypothetical protein